MYEDVMGRCGTPEAQAPLRAGGALGAGARPGPLPLPLEPICQLVGAAVWPLVTGLGTALGGSQFFPSWGSHRDSPQENSS